MSALTQEIEELLRAGRLAEARRRLRELHFRRLPRADALQCANMARRLDLSTLSLKLLNPYVRPPKGRRAHAGLDLATVDERIEYAASLRDLGALDEAMEILGGIAGARHPLAGFHLALCRIAQWDYRRAIPLLRDYLESVGTDTYAAQVGTINLIESLIHEARLSEARPLIRDLERNIDPARHPRLRQKLLELGAHQEIAGEHWERAISRLEEALPLLGKSAEAADTLTIRKWLAVARAHHDGRVGGELNRIREEAMGAGHWETLRDCDFHIARIGENREKLIRLYFGTPFASYRARIAGSLNGMAPLPEALILGDRPDSEPRLDLSLGRTTRARLPAGQALHRLLILLLQDFYRPVPSLSLYSGLFPGEYFQPETSPNRVRQAIKRLRIWLREHLASLKLEERDGAYRLRIDGACAIVLPREPLPLEQGALELVALRRALKPGSFTSQEAADAMGLSRSAAKLLLRDAVATGKIRLEGRTNRARYEWTI